MSISLRCLFMILYGVTSGLLVSAGVFTVLLAVGLVPRFAGKTHTADKILLYESGILWGAVLGGFVSVIPVFENTGGWLRTTIGELPESYGFSPEVTRILLDGADVAGILFLILAGFFMGMFVGCLALAIAEMLNSIPIFARRIGFRHGLGIAVLFVALGKLAGSLFYFWSGELFPG